MIEASDSFDREGIEGGFDAIGYLTFPRWRHVSLGLERTRQLMELLGNPQERFRSIHVAGTNGKGSLCAYLSSILISAGYRTGTLNSPALYRYEDQIRIDGIEISNERLTEIALEVRNAAEKCESLYGEHPTEFELVFAVACMYFKEEGCDVSVIECGLGGRLDATNVLDPTLSVIMPIALDHTAILGNTLEKIAAEKAGIIKQGVPTVSSPQKSGALEVICEVCKERDSALVVADFSSLVPGPVNVLSGRRTFTYKGHTYETSMLGDYQPRNAATAIVCAQTLADLRGFEVDSSEIMQGISDARWEARFQVVSNDPLTIIDGSHNPHGALSLVTSLKSLDLKESSVTFVIGMLADKDFRGVIDTIKPMADTLVTYTPPNERALGAEDLARAAEEAGIKAYSAGSVEDALREAMEIRRPDGAVCAIGSLYSVGPLAEALKKLL